MKRAGTLLCEKHDAFFLQFTFLTARPGVNAVPKMSSAFIVANFWRKWGFLNVLMIAQFRYIKIKG